MGNLETFGNIINFEFGQGILSPLALALGGGILLVLAGFAWQIRKRRSARSRQGQEASSLAELEASQTEALAKMEKLAAEVETQRKEVEALLNRCTEGVATLSALLTTLENTFNRTGQAAQPEKALPGIFTDLEVSLNHEVQATQKAVQTYAVNKASWPKTKSGDKPASPDPSQEESVRLDPPNHRSQATRRAVRLLLREGNSTDEIAKKLNLPLEEAKLIVEVLTKNWNAA
ncbi:MAG: hypothetical protein Q4G68_10965 [Planctomycetia bacterium]|nr:hypothetical protein [Planctomycetia bacterium]